ncbi:hypothetical protein B0H11DRAFT_2219809 [Mycena galericulata]|nr:hypothetical protein B0H11DRAFT_2327576 [Mycena galericulata]KAJ7506444.1 hypothetical protein B0H11DRAFT_2219809 [Mycena galericulata]
MARTKQTARKATGGKAPKKNMHPRALAAVNMVPSPAADMTARRMSKRRPAEFSEEATPLRAKRTHAVTLKELMGKEMYSPSPSSSEHHPHNSWCAGCKDGGRLLGCQSCLRVICDNCIKFPEIAFKEDADVAFFCPDCFHNGADAIPAVDANGKRAGPLVPYQGLFLDGKPLPPLVYAGRQTHRGRWPLGDSSPMTIVSIRLTGEHLAGDPAALAYHHVAPYYRDFPLQFESIVYDLGSTETTDIYDAEVAKLAQRVKTYGPDKFILFITTHATPEGWLWTTAGGVSSTGTLEVVQNATTSLLFLLACGALNTGEAREEVSRFVHNSGFKNGFGFTVPKFLPAAAGLFVQEVVDAFCISHHAKSVYRYVWTNPTTRPYGKPVPLQCPQCGALRSWAISKYTADVVILQCKNAANQEAADFRPLVRPVARWGPCPFAPTKFDVKPKRAPELGPL